MTGHKIKISRGFKLKAGEKPKIEKVAIYRDASQAIAAKKSPKQTWRGAR